MMLQTFGVLKEPLHYIVRPVQQHRLHGRMEHNTSAPVSR
jgi:hypothetical protein